MTRTLTAVPMLPSQSQAKRKVPNDDSSNPLINAAKRAKREGKASSSKRKLLGAEEQPGGMLIVRAPPTHPPPAKPPSKKFRADTPAGPDVSDLQLEKDVRAMDDETDRLRRTSRAHTTIDNVASSSSSSLNPSFQFPVNGKSRVTITDTSVLLPADETPQIQRNKRLREGAMAAIGNGRADSSPASGSEGGRHRRKSSIGRGKRISTSFETTGVITQPHGSVSDSSFYKHIDSDLPDSERVRQLLIWCSSRAASQPTASSSSSNIPDPPPLSSQAQQVLKTLQDDVVRMLAERRIDLSLFGPPSTENAMQVEQKENAQNVTNRAWEVTYGCHIQRATEEEEAWKKVGYHYEAYVKNTKAGVERLKTARSPSASTPSAKAQGKQRARDPPGHDQWSPREHELPEQFQAGVHLARRVLDTSPSSTPDASSSSHPPMPKPKPPLEQALLSRLPSVEFKLDHLHVLASSARTTAEVAAQALDWRFALLSRGVAGRSGGLPRPTKDGGADILGTYVRTANPTASSSSTTPDPVQLMRALARVDAERPPAMVGDAARRAAREVQRVEESGGVGVLGERRLTAVGLGAGTTPRKAPGTPRKARGGTPGRERER
ncbi:Kinetochore protein mis13 [Hypsizygus marmoreus]|uniref:Kinetochore protein mis13 n=1 Tax=Hypsizygus marmoreus TaxID=39966 RepID=A0A369KAI1_HYPMA|nr:Kinetochore protein mis13 [Hypsizygus marmoreus]